MNNAEFAVFINGIQNENIINAFESKPWFGLTHLMLEHIPGRKEDIYPIFHDVIEKKTNSAIPNTSIADIYSRLSQWLLKGRELNNTSWLGRLISNLKNENVKALLSLTLCSVIAKKTFDFISNQARHILKTPFFPLLVALSVAACAHKVLYRGIATITQKGSDYLTEKAYKMVAQSPENKDKPDLRTQLELVHEWYTQFDPMYRDLCQVHDSCERISSTVENLNQINWRNIAPMKEYTHGRMSHLTWQKDLFNKCVEILSKSDTELPVVQLFKKFFPVQLSSENNGKLI